MWYVLLIAALIGVDQLVKLLVVQNFELFESLELWNFIHLTYIHNTGAAFGMMEGARVLFLIFNIVLAAAVLWAWKKPWMGRYKLSVSLIVAGALGNCIDRIFRGYVVDFIDFTYWPVFNVADIAVVCGTILLSIMILTAKEEELPVFGKDKKKEKTKK
ncbi:MAG: signal peptidase II [Firmicutes bacterium]|nr:signal peptidase II [Bacillota bacterium]